MNQLRELWDTHQKAAWPKSLGAHEGQLMMLDTVLAGCVTYFLEEQGLDPQRAEILKDVLSELEEILARPSGSGSGLF